MKSLRRVKHITGLAICSAAVLSGTARAQSAGQLVLNAGWAHVIPNSSFGDAQITGPGFSTTSNTGNAASQTDAFAGVLGYYITDNIEVESFFGIPPKVDQQGTGAFSASALNPVMHSYVWSPMVVAKYVFGTPASKLRPYLGAGVSYIWFSGTSLSGPYQQALSMSFSGGSTASLQTTASVSRQFAPLLVGGFTYNLDAHWLISASAMYMPFSTTTTLTTSLPGGQKITTRQKEHYNTVIPTLMLGYRF